MEGLKVRISQLKKIIPALIKEMLNVYVWSPPGVGKTDAIGQVASDMGLELISLRAVLLDAVDLRGLPNVKRGVAEWCPPAFLPTKGRGILFFDELAQAPTLVQNAIMQLMLERKLGEYTLPDGWTCVAASNRVEDRAGANRVQTALSSRFVHFETYANLEDWLEWALHNNIDSRIRSFLQWKPAMLYTFDPATNDRSFASPRSWGRFANSILRSLDPSHWMVSLAGALGEGAATEFIAFTEVYQQLPKVEDLLRDPEGAPVFEDEPSLLYALIGSLTEYSRNAPLTKVEAVLTYGERLSAEFFTLLLRDVAAIRADVWRIPQVEKWFESQASDGEDT